MSLFSAEFVLLSFISSERVVSLVLRVPVQDLMLNDSGLLHL